MLNLEVLKKAELIAMVKELQSDLETARNIERQEKENNAKLRATSNLDVFAEDLKKYFYNQQVGMFSKFEIAQGINKVYDATMFVQSIGNGNENNV